MFYEIKSHNVFIAHETVQHVLWEELYGLTGCFFSFLSFFQSKMPGMEHVMEIDSDYLMFFMVTMLILALCVKVSAHLVCACALACVCVCTCVCVWCEWCVCCMRSRMELEVEICAQAVVKWTAVCVWVLKWLCGWQDIKPTNQLTNWLSLMSFPVVCRLLDWLAWSGLGQFNSDKWWSLNHPHLMCSSHSLPAHLISTGSVGATSAGVGVCYTRFAVFPWFAGLCYQHDLGAPDIIMTVSGRVCSGPHSVSSFLVWKYAWCAWLGCAICNYTLYSKWQSLHLVWLLLVCKHAWSAWLGCVTCNCSVKVCRAHCPLFNAVPPGLPARLIGMIWVC